MSVDMFKMFIAEEYEHEDHVREQIFKQWTMFSSFIEHGTIRVEGSLSDECVSLIFPDTIRNGGNPLYGVDIDKDIVDPANWSKVAEATKKQRSYTKQR